MDGPTPPAGHDELVDVIDADDRVVAVVPRSVMRRDNLLHRSVGIIVRNPMGEVLVHRRAPTKDVWPDRWDIAVGGVVTSGEGVEEAARRELAEEIGVVDTVMRPLGVGSYEDGDVRCRCTCFETVHDGPVRFADGEVVDARWVSFDTLRAMLVEESFVPDSLALFATSLPVGGGSGTP